MSPKQIQGRLKALISRFQQFQGQDMQSEKITDEPTPGGMIVASIPMTGKAVSHPDQLQQSEVETKPRTAVLLRLAVFSLYLLYIIAAEVITTSSFFRPEVGLLVYCVLLVGLFAHYTLTPDVKNRFMLSTLTFAPLMRILGLSIPLKNYPVLLWYPLVGTPLLLSAVLVARYIHLRPSDIGISLSRWFLQLPVAVSGILLGYIEYRILQPQPLIDTLDLSRAWLLTLFLFIFVGFLEEFVFRGLMQKAFVEGFGEFGGILYVAMLYTFLNLGYHSLPNMIFVFVAALFFGWATLKTRSILGVTLAHSLITISIFLVFPLTAVR